jgi:cyclic beta-1,2-glucan synthetase
MLSPTRLKHLIPSAPAGLCHILDEARGPLEPPIRSQVFGLQRFAEHGRSLGATHRAAPGRAARFFPRLHSNIATLREANQYIGEQASTGYDISPAAEWLLENFHLIEAQLKEIHDGLPRSYFRGLPVLLDPPLAGLPRVYGVAWAFVAHTDSAFDEALLIQFLGAYQETCELKLSEMWALPTTLRVVLVENLRRLAERIAANKAAREVANLCCDHLQDYPLVTLNRLLALLDQRGVGRVFLAQMAQRLQDRRTTGDDGGEPGDYREWLNQRLPDWAAMQTQQVADQAADNLSMCNAITSLRLMSDADWPAIVARTSGLIQLMLTSPVFAAEHPATRDQTLHSIEQLARRCGRSEAAVARTLLTLMLAPEHAPALSRVAGHWLHGEGRAALGKALGLDEGLRLALHRVARQASLPLYLGMLALVTFGWVAWLLHQPSEGLSWAHGWDNANRWTALAALLMLLPASEAVVAVINRLISESARPHRLPRLTLAEGISAEHRVLVVIPALLTGPATVDALAHRLELHYLANPERHAQFALLTDWADAPGPDLPSDAALLAQAVQCITELNTRYPQSPPEPNELDAPDDAASDHLRFIVLHRTRQFSLSEQCWIGWERKRGKLEQLIGALAQGHNGPFINLGAASGLARQVRYVLTLDSDTQLPPGRLRDLVGVAAHPHNQPLLAPDGRSVVAGYGILQPRVATPLPDPKEFTLYHRLFAGQCGIDPYSAASSEVYQDLFGEGTFTGKGLLHVQAVHAVLAARLPEGQVLSHDLLEGSLARCAAVSDITLIEDAPFHADVAASRIHRWTRGDWQLLPMLLNPYRYPMRAINRWKMLDNLRRSLVTPLSLALLLLALAGGPLSPWVALGLVLAAFSAGPLMGAVAGLSPSRDDLAAHHFYRQASGDLWRALWGGLWLLEQLLQQARMALDATLRALYRSAISHRHLLQWTTAATAQAQAATAWGDVLRAHWRAPVWAVALLVLLLQANTPYPLLALALCLLWASSPIGTWWVSRPRHARAEALLSSTDQDYLNGIARDTWRFFEYTVTAADLYLPPDNLQIAPHEMLAHRTSPTNIGMYLLSAACARQFGWIGTQDLLARLEATCATLHTLERHHGHFLNWYDTQTGLPLLPRYISTVDSGNLSAHLLSVAQACRALALAPSDASASQRALHTSLQRLAREHPQWPQQLPRLAPDAALLRLMALPDPLATAQADPAAFELLLHEAQTDLVCMQALHDAWASPPPAPATNKPLLGCLGDHLATLQSALLDQAAVALSAQTHQRLLAMAQNLEALAWAADFRFLYHPARHLFHIGYRVAEHQLDPGFYDLLASESRLTSLLAIAKGDAPVRHWASLGRPFYAVGTTAGLRSWSGSMFEYLMPSLVLNEPYGSVLREACRAALCEQIAFAQALDLPWGMSESAYAGQDSSLAYQYAPQGVPRLALRRTPPDELVVAPYATALAAQIAPHRACSNFAALQALGARQRYGFIEALDFSPARQIGSALCTPVCTFMAHHQGMTIVALTNVLLDNPAQTWGMANAHLEAVTSLLHERPPREVAQLYAPPPGPPQQGLRQRAPGLLREVVPGEAAVPPTQVLSNGRYSVALRPNGAGWSRWGQADISRWRDDALRDAHGSFFYLRWASGGTPVSLTQHPAPDPAAHYHSRFHADRVCFEARWPELDTHCTVWVSPEDDIEFRQIELRNRSDHPLELELLSALDITLSDARADEAHPAFANLFVHAEWQADQQALLFERKPRLPTEQGLQAAHFLAESDPEQVLGLSLQTDRQRWRGRNQDVSQLRADLEPASTVPGSRVVLNTGLDPVCVLALRLRIAPHSRARLTLATAASDDAGTLRAVIDKYRQPSHVERASLMSATLAGIRLRALRISADNLAAIQTLTTALVLSLTRPHSSALPPVLASGSSTEICDKRLLWHLSLSGERPVILVSAGLIQGLGLVRSLAQALQLWAWGGVACDLVVVSAEPASYQMTLHRELLALRDRHLADTHGPDGPSRSGFHVVRADALSADELSTLQTLARIRLHADGRPLLHHVQEWSLLHQQAMQRRDDSRSSAVAVVPTHTSATPAPQGVFAQPSGEFQFEVNPGLRPLRPWINILANPSFGSLVTEGGGGYTWARNSRLMQLTGWSNDPVADPPSEWLLLQDDSSHDTWSATPCAWGNAGQTYQVAHGQGYSRISHRRGTLEVTLTWCVDRFSAVKQLSVQLVNHGPRPRHLRVVGVAEWLMGAQRSDRSTVHTSAQRQPLAEAHSPETTPHPPWQLTTLLATQSERSGGMGGGTAFLALASPAQALEDWTCDRRECFDARGRLVLPHQFSLRSGTGLDPCAALAERLSVGSGASVQRVFLLGYADTPEAALTLAAQAATASSTLRLSEVHQYWGGLLGAATVQTPDPLFDALVNHWLLYQTVSCRLWAKAGFYQAGGATGFRDQLQDAMALVWAAPEQLRQQIVLCASRQFVEGDVQHWWHAPTGAGVRTHFCDDLLWLAYATLHYLEATGDHKLLDEMVPFLDGIPIPPGAEDAYFVPGVSAQQATVYEHAARAIDRSLRVGIHGLPLMGTGDWNDGMNQIGPQGRGESVWLGWLLCQLVAGFAPLARARLDSARAQRWELAAQGWREALAGPAWDGAWFKRAFFDDGQALGTQAGTEARIDLIAQAWAVLSDVAPLHRQQQAMASVEAHLVDHTHGLIRLLDPPLARAEPYAGYIQSYPPGVRENGGQYAHAAVWALMAQAQLAQQPRGHDQGNEQGEHDDLPYRYFTYLSPAHRANHPTQGPVYGTEPYAMAADVASQPPHVGRGGWSWYTGSAGLMHRAAIESILGLKLSAQHLCLMPCLPSHWHEASLTLHRQGRTLHLTLLRATATQALAVASARQAQLLLPGQYLVWQDLANLSHWVVPLLGPDAQRAIPNRLAAPAALA